MLDAVKFTTDTMNATARRRCLPARTCCEIGRPFALRDVPRAGTPARVCLPGVSGRPGTRQGHGRLPARGGARGAWGSQRTVPSDGADKGRWATAGLYTRFRAPCSGAGLTGAPRRPAFGALRSALVGVQPTTVSGPRPSGPGKAAASSRIRLAPTARQRRQYEQSGY